MNTYVGDYFPKVGEKQLLPDEIVKSVVDTVSGIKAFDYVNGISQYHRIQCSPGLHDSLQYLKGELKSISDAEIKIHEYVADGKSKIGQWDNLFGWSAKSATLELLEPENKILADFGAEQISLAAHSTSTDVEAEVVFVGRGLLSQDYEGKDIDGKIVLTTSRASEAQRAACIDRGAIGVLTFVPPSGLDELADLRRYEGLWPEPGEKEKTKFGFALTQADGVKIEKWLEEGKTVKVRAKVDAELGEGKHGVLSAVISGKDTSKEVWLVAHICHPHPGANDNASGSGALAEVFRTIQNLLTQGKIEQLDYSLRFIWMPEWNGMIQFMHNEKELLEKCKFVINADMVGANPCKSGSVLSLFRTPYSLPSSLNNVVSYWLGNEAGKLHDFSKGGCAVPHQWKQEVYFAGSDHYLFTDASVGIPAIMLNQYPDRFYHTSTDTIDKIDTAQMSFVARAITLSALSLCHPRHVCKEELLVLCRNEGANLIYQVGQEGAKILGRCLENPEKVYPRIMRWLGFAKELGIATLDKVEEEWHLISEQQDMKQALKASIEMTYATEMAVIRKAYLGACAEVGLEAKDQEHFNMESYTSNLEIKRKLEYALPPSMLSRIDDKRFAKYMKIAEDHPYIGSKVDEILNLCSDWKSVDEIVDRIWFQFGIRDTILFEGIIEDLKDLGVIETREM